MTRQIPMLFSGEMMRAHREGLKTETRRVLKKPSWAQDKGWPERIMDEMDLSGRLQWYHKNTGCCSDLLIAQPGDLIWVKESHFAHGIWGQTGTKTRTGKDKRAFHRIPTSDVLFDLDLGLVRPSNLDDVTGWYKRSSLFMEKADSRLTLRVTDVAVERLQEITDEAALAEGVEAAVAPIAGSDISIDGEFWPGGPIRMYSDLWNRINGPGAWAQNPWVVVYRYEPIWQNVLEVAG